MKVITIKQPYASLIAEGLKRYEFRTWRTRYRGEILIHAGKGVDKEAMKKFECYHLEYPTGCIIAKAVITDCVYVDYTLRKMLQEENPLVYSGVVCDPSWDGYGFQLENVEKIDVIPVNGKLSLWDYPYEDN